jgi:hypothetical protein
MVYVITFIIVRAQLAMMIALKHFVLMYFKPLMQSLSTSHEKKLHDCHYQCRFAYM